MRAHEHFKTVIQKHREDMLLREFKEFLALSTEVACEHDPSLSDKLNEIRFRAEQVGVSLTDLQVSLKGGKNV